MIVNFVCLFIYFLICVICELRCIERFELIGDFMGFGIGVIFVGYVSFIIFLKSELLHMCFQVEKLKAIICLRNDTAFPNSFLKLYL